MTGGRGDREEAFWVQGTEGKVRKYTEKDAG